MKKDSEVRKLRVWGLQRPEWLQRRRMGFISWEVLGSGGRAAAWA